MSVTRFFSVIIGSVSLMIAASADKPSPIAFHMRASETVALPAPGVLKAAPAIKTFARMSSERSGQFGAASQKQLPSVRVKYDGVAVQTGMACFYSDAAQGKLTSSGEPFDNQGLTAAHATYPLGSHVRVTNLSTQKSVTLVITDRAPFGRGRIINVSHHAAEDLDFVKAGTTYVRVEYLAEKSVTD